MSLSAFILNNGKYLTKNWRRGWRAGEDGGWEVEEQCGVVKFHKTKLIQRCFQIDWNVLVASADWDSFLTFRGSFWGSFWGSHQTLSRIVWMFFDFEFDGILLTILLGIFLETLSRIFWIFGRSLTLQML